MPMAPCMVYCYDLAQTEMKGLFIITRHRQIDYMVLQTHVNTLFSLTIVKAILHVHLTIISLRKSVIILGILHLH